MRLNSRCEYTALLRIFYKLTNLLDITDSDYFSDYLLRTICERERNYVAKGSLRAFCERIDYFLSDKFSNSAVRTFRPECLVTERQASIRQNIDIAMRRAIASVPDRPLNRRIAAARDVKRNLPTAAV